MSEFNPGKLHVSFDKKVTSKNFVFPRKYTLTHSDKTGDLFLSIGVDFDYKKFSSLYSKLMRDEVLGEWKKADQLKLVLQCLASGGIALGSANWRKSIFRKHMKMVLNAISYGDRFFLSENQSFLRASVYVHFFARQKKHNCIEKWGTLSDFMPSN